MKSDETFTWRGVHFHNPNWAGNRWESIATPTMRLDATVDYYLNRPGFTFVATIRSNPGMKTGHGDSPGTALDGAYGAWFAFFHSLPSPAHTISIG